MPDDRVVHLASRYLSNINVMRCSCASQEGGPCRASEIGQGL